MALPHLGVIPQHPTGHRWRFPLLPGHPHPMNSPVRARQPLSKLTWSHPQVTPSCQHRSNPLHSPTCRLPLMPPKHPQFWLSITAPIVPSTRINPRPWGEFTHSTGRSTSAPRHTSAAKATTIRVIYLISHVPSVPTSEEEGNKTFTHSRTNLHSENSIAPR